MYWYINIAFSFLKFKKNEHFVQTNDVPISRYIGEFQFKLLISVLEK